MSQSNLISRFSVCLFAGAVCVLMGVDEGRAQDPETQTDTSSQDEDATVFRSGITLVTTDVIVRDSDGVFVPDLNQNDFRVFEDGVLQEVASLVLVHGGRVYNQLLPPPPSQEGIILPPTRAVSGTAGRIFIILIDDLHIITRDTPRTRQIFEQLTDNLIHEGDLFGIVSTGPSAIAVDLTYDRGMLQSAANRITGDGFNPSELAQQISPGQGRGASELTWRAHTAFKTARTIVKELEKIQNRRKVFLYFSSGYNFNPFTEERAFSRNLRAQGNMGINDVPGIYSYDGGQDRMVDPFDMVDRQGEVFSDADLAFEIADLAKAANRANASFYTVDPRGLIAGPDIDYNFGIQAFNDWRFKTQNSLRALSELTGGKAIVNRNDFDDAFREIDAETSDYYVVGFYSGNSDPTFRTRRLTVEVNRESVDVQHRSHYTYERQQ